MSKTVNTVLGSEYKVAIEAEIKQLKQSEQKLLGDIVAVVKRSDRLMGRPSNDCTETDESIYVIFEPTKHGIVCHKDLGSIKCANGNYKLVSLNYFVEQVLEFNFTYLQLLFASNIVYKTQLYNEIWHMVHTSVLENANGCRGMAFTKLVSTAIGIMGDINKGKFNKDKKQLQNRVFLVYKIIEILKDNMRTGAFDFRVTFDANKYTKYVTQLDYSELNKEIANLIEYEKETFGNIENLVMQETKENNKFDIMHTTISRIVNAK